MRDRLIDILQSKPYGQSTYEEFADYLIENGVIVPPCKVGDTVYEIQPFRNRVQPYEIISIKYNGHYWFIMWKLKDDKGIYGNLYGFVEHRLGKEIFLTKEKAEKALRGEGE